MAKRISISDDYLKLDDIVRYKEDVEKAIKFYFKYGNFPLLTKEEILNRQKEILKELELNIIFMLLSSIEAWIRVDYEYRVRKRLKDELSRELRKIDKRLNKPYQISIEKLCDIYKKYCTRKSLFSELKSAFKLRHWLAHGRYWKLKIGKKYDFSEVYQLAISIYNLLIVKSISK